jgi:hypothetical protein
MNQLAFSVQYMSIILNVLNGNFSKNYITELTCKWKNCVNTQENFNIVCLFRALAKLGKLKVWELLIWETLYTIHSFSKWDDNPVCILAMLHLESINFKVTEEVSGAVVFCSWFWIRCDEK